MSTMAPLCFVLMPFGRKPAGDGRIVDFDSVYEGLVGPAVRAAGLEPLRADEEMAGGLIHKAMFERLILCEFAVADLTTANANVFYELGVRHAVRPWATQLLFADGWGQLPFDVHSLRALPYKLRGDGTPSNAAADGASLKARLDFAKGAVPDSPVFQLVEGFPDVQHLKTDIFRDRVRYADGVKSQLASARAAGASAVRKIEATLGNIADADAAVVVALFLSYRAVSDWGAMIELVSRMADPLAATVMVREQLALALNRAGQPRAAEQILVTLIAERGPSSETYGLLGRVYKDQWEVALAAGDSILASGLLEKAIRAYLKGFEADSRDAYPGVNAVTLMELGHQPDSRQVKLIPVVAFAVERRIAHGDANYWDYATQLELMVLASDHSGALSALGDALAHVREPWEPETTLRNLRLIRESRAKRGGDVRWLEQLERQLADHHRPAGG